MFNWIRSLCCCDDKPATIRVEQPEPEMLSDAYDLISKWAAEAENEVMNAAFAIAEDGVVTKELAQEAIGVWLLDAYCRSTLNSEM